MSHAKHAFTHIETGHRPGMPEKRMRPGFHSSLVPCFLHGKTQSLGNETGADYMLFGSVKTIVDQTKGKTLRSYVVNAELIDIETNKKVWVGENSEIRKLITRSSVRW